jgi:hypothetical protein
MDDQKQMELDSEVLPVHLFMQVLCMSKKLRPQQLALSGILFQRVGRCSTAMQNHFTEFRLIVRLLSLGHPEGDCKGTNLAPQ